MAKLFNYLQVKSIELD